MRTPIALLCTVLVAGCGGDSNNGGSGGDASGMSGDGGGADAHIAGDDGGKGGDGGGGNPCVPPSSLVIAPADVSAMVVVGGGFTQAYAVTAKYAMLPDADVTNASFLTLSDPTLGTLAGATFTWGGTHGGTATVTAKSCGVIGTTTLNLMLSGNVGSGMVDPKQAAMQFGNAPPSLKVGCAPTLVYPPDGVLLPPNTNVIEVHFLPGSPPNNLFEISFSNQWVNVKIYSSCTGKTPADGMPLNGGCVFELDQKEWDYIAQTNRNGDPVTVAVRGLGCDGNNVAASAKRQISFAKDDLVGTLYYWASINLGGLNPYSGGVFRYEFGRRGQAGTPVLTPTNLPNVNPGFCIGCHDVSLDGRKMVFDYDDNNGDDEYGDVSTDIFDIAKQVTAIQNPLVKGQSFPPGYHTWNRETKEFLLSDGDGNRATPAGAFRRVDPLGATLGYTQGGMLRGTTPNWKPDDSEVVFAVPPNVSTMPPAPGYWMGTTDLFFAGASLYTAPWDPINKKLGVPVPLITAVGTKNYYYPSYSPDGSLIAFDYAESGPNFHNPLARVQMVAAGQVNPTPVDLAKLNDQGGVTNSWARWSPFVQSYKSGNILWITTSSTRNYGLRIINDNLQNCYPVGSPKGYTSFISNPIPGCTRTQIWMAAVRLDANAVKNGTDVSWPAFQLPFQDLSTNNHLAQWAQKSFSGTCAKDADCALNQCCDNGGCTSCPPPPRLIPACTVDANCAPGFCCQSAACTPCGSDGGVPAPDGGGCNSCLDCKGQACINGTCGSCQNSAQCCAPLVCDNGTCVMPIM